MIQCNMGDRSAEVCFDIHQWLGSPSVNTVHCAVFAAVPFRFICFESAWAPHVSAVGQCQQHICGSLLLVQVQKS